MVKVNDVFVFTELKKEHEQEILDLKNDVLKLVEEMDKVQQQTINLNAKIKFNHRETCLMIEDLYEKIKD